MASILKVNTIQDATNSNTAMTIDSSGRILTPTRPHALVNFGGGASDTYETVSDGLLPFDTIVHEVGSNYDTTNKRYVAPVAGLYLITFNCIFNGVTTFNCYLQVDGSVVHRWYVGDSRHMTWTTLQEVSASSYFDIGHNTGADRSIHGGSGGSYTYTQASYTLIG